MALRTLLGDGELDPGTIDYVLNSGEEAVGERYQRGGGNLAKAVGEMCGLSNATGSDVKAFCCGPVHALVLAGALVGSGVFDSVAVVGGCSLAKLGMKFRGHLHRDYPILEGVLAAVAVLVGRDDGSSPCPTVCPLSLKKTRLKPRWTECQFVQKGSNEDPTADNGSGNCKERDHL